MGLNVYLAKDRRQLVIHLISDFSFGFPNLIFSEIIGWLQLMNYQSHLFRLLNLPEAKGNQNRQLEMETSLG